MMVSKKCQVRLDKKLEELCGTKELRGYVACLAAKYRAEDPKIGWGDSIRRAWAEAHKTCPAKRG